MRRQTKESEMVALFLPNVAANIVSFFALQTIGRIPVMLNFSSGKDNLKKACTTAEIKTVYSSKAFIKEAKLEEEILAINSSGVRVIYLEDLALYISIFNKVAAVIKVLFSSYFISKKDPEDPALVLFTSGSESIPKAVVLSHKNILANCYQTNSMIDFNSNDIVFNCLPMFHSFGLTMGTIFATYFRSKNFFISISTALSRHSSTLLRY